jgi:tetratricopeptide (TPR) repeat protein
MRLRMAEIVTKFCKDERAVDAGNALLVSYNIDGDLEKLEEWTVRLKDKGCGGSSQVAQTQQGSIKKLSQQVRFKKAEQLLAQKRFAEAATLFIELVGQDPRGPDADKALFNAAVAQESDRRYGAATETYERIVREYPQSTLVDESLFRAAVNHQRFFEYDKAVEAYQKLGTEPRFKGSSHRHDALYNAALIAENDQRYALAADLWKQYAQSDKTNQEEAATAYFRAALSIEKLGPAARAVQELSQFVERYGSNGSFLPQVVEAYVRLARVEQKQGNPFDASEHWKRAAQLGQKLPPGSDAAEYAAEAAFLIAEQKLQEVEKPSASVAAAKSWKPRASPTSTRRCNEAVVVYDKVLGVQARQPHARGLLPHGLRVRAVRRRRCWPRRARRRSSGWAPRRAICTATRSRRTSPASRTRRWQRYA